MTQAVNQSPGNCACGPCSVDILGKILGCSSFALTGLTVEAHDATAGGSLLASTTTNISGDYTFTGVPGVAGNDIVIVPIGGLRFVANNRTLNWTSGTPSATQWSCGFTTPTTTRTLLPATGYHCISSCAYPVKDTLDFTDSVLGSWVITWVAGQWQGTHSYSYSGDPCGLGCTAQTLTLNALWNGAAINVTWGNSNNPTTPFVAQCPLSGGAFSVGYAITPTIICPPSFSAIGSATTPPCLTGTLFSYIASLYGPGVTVTRTLTEH